MIGGREGKRKDRFQCTEFHLRFVNIGDVDSVADEMASTLSISNVHAGLKPEQKLDYILRNSPGGLEEHNRFVMVGDGLNDAPALSAADVGIAIASTANGASASAANLVILNGQGVGSLPFLFHLADQTRQIVTQVCLHVSSNSLDMQLIVTHELFLIFAMGSHRIWCWSLHLW